MDQEGGIRNWVTYYMHSIRSSRQWRVSRGGFEPKGENDVFNQNLGLNKDQLLNYLIIQMIIWINRTNGSANELFSRHSPISRKCRKQSALAICQANESRSSTAAMAASFSFFAHNVCSVYDVDVFIDGARTTFFKKSEKFAPISTDIQLSWNNGKKLLLDHGRWDH